MEWVLSNLEVVFLLTNKGVIHCREIEPFVCFYLEANLLSACIVQRDETLKSLCNFNTLHFHSRPYTLHFITIAFTNTNSKYTLIASFPGLPHFYLSFWVFHPVYYCECKQKVKMGEAWEQGYTLYSLKYIKDVRWPDCLNSSSILYDSHVLECSITHLMPRVHHVGLPFQSLRLATPTTRVQHL